MPMRPGVVLVVLRAARGTGQPAVPLNPTGITARDTICRDPLKFGRCKLNFRYGRCLTGEYPAGSRGENCLGASLYVVRPRARARCDSGMREHARARIIEGSNKINGTAANSSFPRIYLRFSPGSDGNFDRSPAISSLFRFCSPSGIFDEMHVWLHEHGMHNDNDAGSQDSSEESRSPKLLATARARLSTFAEDRLHNKRTGHSFRRARARSRAHHANCVIKALP